MTAGENKLLEFVNKQLTQCGWETEDVLSGVYTRNGCRLHFLLGDNEAFIKSANDAHIYSAGNNWYVEKFRRVLYGGKLPIMSYKIDTGDASVKNKQIFMKFMDRVNSIAESEDFLLLPLITTPSILSNPSTKVHIIRSSNQDFEVGCDCSFSDEVLKGIGASSALFHVVGIQGNSFQINPYDKDMEKVQSSGMVLEAEMLRAMQDSGDMFVAEKEYYSGTEELYIWNFNEAKLSINPVLSALDFKLTALKKSFINQAMNDCLNFSDLLQIPDNALKYAYEFLKIGASLKDVTIRDAKISSHILSMTEYGADYRALSKIRGNFESYISAFNVRLQKVIESNSLDSFQSLRESYKYAVLKSITSGSEFQDPGSKELMELILDDLDDSLDTALIEFVRDHGLCSYHDYTVPMNVLTDAIKEMVIRKFTLAETTIGDTAWNTFIENYLKNATVIGYNHLGNFFIAQSNSCTIMCDNCISVKLSGSSIWCAIKLNGGLYVCKNEEKLSDFLESIPSV